MNQFDEMQAFVAVVEAGSFTAAAKRQRTTKSVISRRLSALEERLGAQLLQRTTRAQTLTESGRSFLAYSKRILDDLDEAESSVSQQHGSLQGSLRIALPLSFGVRHLCGPISAFRHRHPDVAFDLQLGDRYVDLIQQNIDMALRIGKLSDSSLAARKLFDVRMVVCASPAYLNRYGEPQEPDDLRQHRCLLYTNARAPDQWSYRGSANKAQQVAVGSTLQASSGDFLCNAAAHGEGLVLLPTFIVAQTVRSGKLRTVLNDYDWPGPAAYAVYPSTRHLSHRVRAFIDFLAEKFSTTPQWDKDCGW